MEESASSSIVPVGQSQVPGSVESGSLPDSPSESSTRTLSPGQMQIIESFWSSIVSTGQLPDISEK